MRFFLIIFLAIQVGSVSTVYATTQGKIGLIQYDADSTFGNTTLHQTQLTTLADKALKLGATIILFPEGSSFGYSTKKELWCKPGMKEFQGKLCKNVSQVAEPIPGGKTTQYWVNYAIKNQVFLLASVIEVQDNDYFNSTALVGPSGYVGKYRKRSLYITDQAYATAGTQPFVLRTPYGNFGLLTCLDASYDGPYYQDYKKPEIAGILLSMNWDENPLGSDAAKDWFRKRAKNNSIDIYASDVSKWDGTGFYPASGFPRIRNGLPEPAIGQDGVSIQPIRQEYNSR